jgi:outer membrane receptor protein involved in Fe transport
MACLSALALSGPALADETQSTSGQIEEVVVTASKRNENLQEVPSSVSAQSGIDLERLKLEQLSDYLSYVPGISVNSGGAPGIATITVRGISPLGAGSTVATYINDAPLGSSGIWARAQEFELDLLPFDLDRLELLRGPQGTLYGADAIGGALKYVLNTPDLARFDVEVGADFAEIDGSGGLLATEEARINTPLIQDQLAVSLSVFNKHNPGYIDDLATGQKDVNAYSRYGGRFAAFWLPSEQFSVKLDALYQKIDAHDLGAVSYQDLASTTQADGTVLVAPNGGLDSRLTEAHSVLQPFSKSVQFYSLTGDWNPGPVEVTSTTSWSRTELSQQQDASIAYGSAFPLLTGGAIPAGLATFNLGLGLDKLTEELRVTSPSDQPLEWLVGAFYTDERESNTQFVYGFDSSYHPIPAFQPDLAAITLPTTYRELAAFGDLTWHISSRLDIGGGVREAHNKQSFDSSTSGVLIGSGNVVNNSSADVTTWLGDARYHFTRDLMGYLRFATGYAPGGPNSPIPGANIPATVGSETLKNYELGLKSEFFNHHVKVNVAGYNIKWTDIQLPATLNNESFTENGGSATSRGFELESTFLPVAGLLIGVNAAYTASYLNSLQPDVSVAFPLHTQLAEVPRWTVSGTFDYAFIPAPGWTAQVGGGVRWVDTQLGQEPAAGSPLFPTLILPSYTAADLDASLTHDWWTIRAYVRNLSNVRAEQGVTDWLDIFGNSKQLDYYILQPRTIGIGVSVKLH